MSRLLRSLKFMGITCWQNNISMSLKAVAIAFSIIVLSAGSSFSQNEFPCELSISCPPSITVECGTNLEDLSITGTVEFDTFDCGDNIDVTHSDAVISSNGCVTVYTRTWVVSVIGGPSDMCTQTITVQDTTGPVFLDAPADITYQCVGDIEAQPMLETWDCTGVDEVVLFESETGNDTLDCTLSTPVGPGPDWAVWLSGLTGMGLASNDYYTWVAGTATMEFYDDGTAHISGDIVNFSNPTETWFAEFWMENGKNWADWSAMGRSYKDDLGFGAATHTSWSYYELVPVFSKLVGTGSNAGSNLYLSHQPSNYYFGYQFGQGANNRNNQNGGSGWFYFWGWVDGEYVQSHGDLTIDKECVPVEHPNIACENSYTRFWRATDDCGNVSFADQEITVHDTTPPVFENCYPDLTYECGDEIPAALPASGLIATDNCNGPVAIIYVGSETTVLSDCAYDIKHTYLAQDTCDNRDSCVYTIHVLDTTAPELMVPANATFECDEEIVWGMASAYDVCQGDLEVMTSEPMFHEDDCYGYYTRDFYVNDGCDNVATGTQTIWIEDTTAPVFNPFDIEVYVECDMVEFVAIPTATDNCDEQVEVTYTDILNSGGCLGVIMRTLTATDNCGNTTIVVQYIHIQDNTPANIDEPADMTVECDNVPVAPGAEGADIYDNCGMEVTVEFHTSMMEGPCANSYTILWIWEAWDYCENYSTDTTVITVVDTTNPELWVPEGATYSCDEEWMIGDATATDNCDENVEITYTDVTTPGECPQEYSVTRTWVAVDNCGNSSSGSTTYYVVDNEAPMFTEVPGGITIECDMEIPATSAVASDNCGLVTITSEDFYEYQSECYSLIIRTFTAIDECGNYSTATQNITILDTTAPVINYEVEIELPCDDYDGIYATATDNCSEEVSVFWVGDELASGGCQGRVIRTYGAYDNCQNYTEVQQFITLTDNIDPYVVYQTPNQTIECGSPMPEVMVDFADNCDDEVSVVSGVNSDSDGCITVYTYTFTGTDNCDNSISTNVVITIVDTTNPYFMELPSDMTINCYEEVPAIVIPMAYDICDAEVEVEVTDVVLPGECPNEYTVVRTYRAFDNCGNQVVESRYIYVVDNDAPAFDDQVSSYSYECDDDIALIEPTAYDLCGDYTITHSDFWEIESDCYGLLIRVWTATDLCGNWSSFTQVISIYDATAPVIAGDFEIEMPCDQISYGIFATATDNCDDDVYIEIVSDELASGGCAGRIIRTYRAWDNCDNWSEFTQFITLTDVTAPVASVDPEDATYECDQLWLPAFVTFTDNCDMELVLTANVTSTTDGCTTVYTYIWTATDHCLNSTTVDQVITVTDTTYPVASFDPEDFTIECGSFWDIVVPTFADNCDQELTLDNGFSDEMVDCDQILTFWWSATDDCGNTTTVGNTVTIEDTTPPMLYVPVSNEFSCDEEIMYGDASAYDACDENVEVEYADVVLPGNCPQSYTIVRTWTATDDCGNTSTESTSYYIYDNETPEFTEVPADMTLECSDEIPASNATAMDNCDLEVEVTQSDYYYMESDCYTLIIRTFTATDDCGNSITESQNISIYDTTAPVFAGEFEIEMPCDEITYGIFVTATDNCDEDVYIEIISDELASGGCAGRIIRTYRAWDNCQNWSEFVQFITLTDETAPVASSDPEDMFVECGDQWSPAVVTFTDNCDEELSLFPDVTVTATECTTVYHYTWLAIDHCENATSVHQTITITDTQAPMINDENSESTVDCNVIVDFILPTAYDYCDENVEVMGSYMSSPGECPGEYTEYITFTATDDCGNTSSVTHVVHHVDNDAPMLENIPQGGEYECDEMLPNDMPTAFDYCSDATVMSDEDIIEGNCPNSYIVVRSFWAVDECGNMSDVVTVSYYVYDNTAPVFTNGVSDEYYQCLNWDTYEVQMVGATDNCGEATVTHEIFTDYVDNCGNGWWYVLYTATDLCGNYDEMSYWINVQDTQAPVLSSMPADLVVDCGDELPEAPIITATDNCDEFVNVTMTESCMGDCPEEGEEDCELRTPIRPAGNVCNYPVDWAMALFAMPNAHKWYQLVEGSGSLTDNGDGTLTASGTLVNAYDPTAGFTFTVNFINGLDWAAWSSQSFPTGFKDDCGGEGFNHEAWMYYILQNGAGAELVGWGTYAGSAIDLSHAPTNQYFGFQYGDGANNYNGDNGLGGWFKYHGTFLVNNEPIMSGFAAGAGDFAFEVDCCPDYQIVRCWYAVDCTGNSTSWCQTISFGDLDSNIGDVAPMAPATETEKGEIAITSIMPNPANYRSQISFMSKESGKLSLQIMDMTGRIVADLYNNVVVGGVEYKADFDASNIPSGMYMVRLSSASESDMDRIQIMK